MSYELIVQMSSQRGRFYSKIHVEESVLSQYTRVTVGQTHRTFIATLRLHSVQRGTKRKKTVSH